MKSTLADFRRSKIAILTILEALNFDFWEFQKFLKFKPAKIVKIAVFEAPKCHNRFHVKFEWQKKPKNFTL